MDKIFTLALVVAVAYATTAMFANNRLAVPQHPSADAPMANDGAFRDGIYVGRLAAEAGRPKQPQIGRWSSAADRASFVSGYQRGYAAFLAGSELATKDRAQ